VGSMTPSCQITLHTVQAMFQLRPGPSAVALRSDCPLAEPGWLVKITA
jgi:hypothetical protein